MFLQNGGGTVGSAQINDDSIVNDDINSAAAIDATKLANVGFQKLASATQAVGATTLATSAFAAKRLLKVLISLSGTGAASLNIRFNSDTGSNYDFYKASNGGAADVQTGVTAIELENSAETQARVFEITIVNVATREKQVMSRGGAAGEWYEGGGEWNNTADQITSIQLFIDDTGNINAGSTIDVFGTN